VSDNRDKRGPAGASPPKGTNGAHPAGDPSAGDGSSVAASTTALVPHGGEGEICFVRFAVRPPFDKRLVLWRHRDSESATSYRLLRQRLIERGDPHMLLCTSANPGEGKTTLAANLALAFAELGRHRVLLIEASFRGAALGEVFGFKPPKGFAEQLARHRTRPGEPWVVVQIGTTQLFVMAAEPRCCPHCAAVIDKEARFCGQCGKSVAAGATAALDAVTFATAVRRFRDAFDYLIVDAPAVLSSGDVNLIQDATDGIIFAVRKGRSQARELRRAVEQVSPAPVLAVALIDA
jgi:Mrp family chromosome partitioning ATPase